ncbi:MAG: ABC transporter ATP-binding protein [Rhodocyclaceae bacterium]|nr:ABC transporter ATP-binding protein [Rhodocyclaceae bacterium]
MQKHASPGPFHAALRMAWATSPGMTLAVLAGGGTLAALSLAPYLLLHDMAAAALAPAPQPEAVRRAIAGLAAVLLLRQIGMAVTFRLSHRLAYGGQAALRARMIEKLAQVPLGYFDHRNAQSVRSAVIDDVDALEDGVAHLLPRTVAALAGVVLVLAAMAARDWRLALAALLPAIVGMLLMVAVLAGARQTVGRYMALVRSLAVQTDDLVRGMATVRIYAAAGRMVARLEAGFAGIVALAEEWMRRMSVPAAAIPVLAGAAPIAVLAAWIWLHAKGQSRIEDLLFFVLCGLAFAGILKTIYDLQYRGGQLRGAQKRIDDLLGAGELQAPRQASRLPRDAGLCFSGVVLSHGERQALRGIDLTVAPGERVALVGPSGAGKSSLARLAVRAMDPDAGRVTVGGVDLRELPAEALAASVGCIFQESHLFADTVASNLRIGDPAADMETVVAAARAANVHEAIMALPTGYDTVLDGGIRLSGGETQRLALARLFLRKAPILILDEATAHADPENEILLQQAIGRLSAGKTLLVVAHRLSSIVDFDRIVVLQDGLIAGQGRHPELLAACPLYARMWAAHLGRADFFYSTRTA